ncbi:hypothetical protein HYN48_02340 [Flavobacterium magnum]|uniref:Alpha-ketoglutarate decarboxylase n=1 Tax=Flavobacterium magnum TaxID=2162713 RepID=A0A2S0RCL2_9FLAO|nr:hypothetical protein [Flavobacterium magnum]AWA29020.1 hypothetical protein HYN48_02340 [Flavobacterium magnum]
MKTACFENIPKYLLCLLLANLPLPIFAQDSPSGGGDFWSHVRFGGGIGASFGNDYTNVSLAPGALYQFNQYFGLGVGLQGSFVKVDGDYTDSDLNHYKSWIYGGSVLGAFNPIEELQLSAELEQVRVNSTFTYPNTPDIRDNFWNTALYLGAGYNTGDVTVGVRYNVLFDRDKSVYADPFMPFVRVYF